MCNIIDQLWASCVSSNYHCQSLILSFLYRYLSRLKSYLWNRATSEGSIVEEYIVEECLTFCSRYMEGVEAIFNQPTRMIKESIRVVSIVTLNNKEWTQAHCYVLFNSEKHQPLLWVSTPYTNMIARQSNVR